MEPIPAAGAGQPLGSRYVLGGLLGRGGMGEVFLVRDRSGKAYAAKILRPELARDQEVVGRFVTERAILTGLRGAHVVGVHDLVVEGDTLALVVDLVEGTDLRRELSRVGALPPGETARIGAGVAAALAAAHAAGVVHLDVKPENVLLETVGAGPPAVRLADFGVARIVRAGGGEAGERYGTPRYVAPEVASGEPVGPAADLYSLGVLLYELGSGRPPFDGEPAEVLEAHARRIPARPPGLPDPLWHLVAGLLAKRPEHRPGPAARVQAELEAMLGRGAAVPPPPVPVPVPGAGTSPDAPTAPVPAAATRRLAAPVAGPPGVPRPVRRRRRGRLAAAAAAFALGTAAGAWAIFGDFDSRSGGTPAVAAEAPAEPGAEQQGGDAEAAAPVEAGCAASVAGDARYPGELSTALGGTYVEDVVRVQQRLRERGYDICVDGDYGPRTAEAVSAFQRANGLPGGGAVGPVTWAKLFGQEPAPAAAAPAPAAPAQPAPPAPEEPEPSAPEEPEPVTLEPSVAPASPAPATPAPEPSPSAAPAAGPTRTPAA